VVADDADLAPVIEGGHAVVRTGRDVAIRHLVAGGPERGVPESIRQRQNFLARVLSGAAAQSPVSDLLVPVVAAEGRGGQRSPRQQSGNAEKSTCQARLEKVAPIEFHAGSLTTSERGFD